MSLPTPDNADPELLEAWQDWIQDRAERKIPLTSVAAKRQLKRLAKWGTEKSIQAIDNSINHRWIDLYEPKDFGNGQSVPLWQQIKNIEQEIANHRANFQGLAYDPDCSEAERLNLNNKRDLLHKLKNGQTSSQQS